MTNNTLDPSAYTPDLDLLRQAISPWVTGFKNHTIKVGASPSSVHRLSLEYAHGRTGIASVILKAAAPVWPDDPNGPDREQRFYTLLFPQLGAPWFDLYYVGIDPRSQHRILLIEDVTAGFRFPPPTHAWREDEMRCMLRAYARLHSLGRNCLPPEDQRSWMWRPALLERDWRAEDLLDLFRGLVDGGVWLPLSGIEQLIERTLADSSSLEDYSLTLLHNDIFPPNVGLPKGAQDQAEAILLDWEMVGWGLAELDLAFMFMQPYRSARRVCRKAALDYYWNQRRALEGNLPPLEQRQKMQRHADALWALSLIPVAHRVSTRPFPPGSEPARYWDSMFAVLYERLCDLCNGGRSKESRQHHA